MHGGVVYNAEAGNPQLPTQKEASRQFPPSYSVYPSLPAQGNPAYPPQGNPGYPPHGNPGYSLQGNPGYPPQGAGYPSQAPVAHPVVQNVCVPTPVGSKPIRTTCRSCNTEIITGIKTKSSGKTHLIALLLCVVGCCLCMCIPYCMDSCLNIEHYCPQCNAYIGTYKH